MSGAVFYWALVLAQLFLAGAALIGVWRIAKGPRAQDRILGLDLSLIHI